MSGPTVKRTETSAIVKIYLCKWWWVIKRKEDERKKKKEGVLEGCPLFSFLLFGLFSQAFFLVVILVQIWLSFFVS